MCSRAALRLFLTMSNLKSLNQRLKFCNVCLKDPEETSETNIKHIQQTRQNQCIQPLAQTQTLPPSVIPPIRRSPPQQRTLPLLAR